MLGALKYCDTPVYFAFYSLGWARGGSVHLEIYDLQFWESFKY